MPPWSTSLIRETLAVGPIPTYQKEYLQQAERVGWTIGSSPVSSLRMFLKGLVPARLTEQRKGGLPLPRESEHSAGR